MRTRLLVFVLFLMPVLTACAGSSLKPLTGGARAPGAKFYVASHAKDSRNIQYIIANEMARRGFAVVAGRPEQRPAEAQYVVTYEDRWSWDMRVYLGRITIRVNDARSGQLLGESESHQGSLAAMGDKFEEIIVDTTKALFDKSRL